MALKWEEKNSSDAGNAVWIAAKTKQCPSCKVRIEKNQGCNHMTCRNCKHEFCWLCFGKWSGHNSCSEYAKSNDTARAEEALSDLERYTHFYDRFMSHQRSIRFAEKTRAHALTRVQALAEREAAQHSEHITRLMARAPIAAQAALESDRIVSHDYLLRAVELVIECHRLLQWTYVYTFFWPDRVNEMHRRLFLDQQSLLETFTDRLHELAEQPIDRLLTGDSRANIITYTSAVSKYLTNVVDAAAAAGSDFRIRQ